MPGRPAEAADSARLFLKQLDCLEEWATERANFPSPANRQETLQLVAQAREKYQQLIDADPR